MSCPVCGHERPCRIATAHSCLMLIQSNQLCGSCRERFYLELRESNRKTVVTRMADNLAMKREPNAFARLTFQQMGDGWPLATVLYDRDVASKVANPVILARWGHLYVGARDDLDICWCWDEIGQKWDDMGGGSWAAPHGAEWLEAVML